MILSYTVRSIKENKTHESSSAAAATTAASTAAKAGVVVTTATATATATTSEYETLSAHRGTKLWENHSMS